MQEREIIKFNTVAELQITLKKELDLMQKKSEEYSKLVGEKLRSGQGGNPGEFEELKAMLEGPKDPKKKPSKKKETKNWKEFDSVQIYDGIGLKGELEIYFQALEETKLKVEKLKKIVDSIDKLVTQGLKKELGCLVMMTGDLSFRMSFLGAGQAKPRFGYKSIFNVEAENPIEIKI